MDVSIIIVNYNTKDLTKKCIESVIKYTTNILYEIILVDNASMDGSKELFEKDIRIKYIYNSTNDGFGKANNLGLKYSSGKYVFLLNSDTILMNNAVYQFYKAMENDGPLVACMGCVGRYKWATHQIFWTIFDSQYYNSETYKAIY